MNTIDYSKIDIARIRRHILKTDPEVFDAMWAGHKTHEIRFNDRDFKVGDELILKRTEFSGEQMKNGAPLRYTSRSMFRVVSHVQTGYGLKDGWVILSVQEPSMGVPL